MAEDHPLLELQRIDASADALRARRAALPERAKLRDGEAELSALEQARGEAHERRLALGREARRVDEQVADLEARARAVEKDLYSGRLSAPRELEALQTELRDFQRRQREREDEELVLLEQEERTDAEIASLGARSEALAVEVAALRASLGAAESRLDAELERLAAARTPAAARLSAEWLGAYEKLRALPRLGGRVAAAVEGGTCTGCGMALPTAVASRLPQEPAEAIVHCPHCGRILAH
jgi:hypothetical protein